MLTYTTLLLKEMKKESDRTPKAQQGIGSPASDETTPGGVIK